MIVDTAGRRADDGTGRLFLHTTCDGDIVLSVRRTDQDGFGTEMRFCTLMGGGRSPKVLRALRALRDAIKEQNLDDPLAEVTH